MAERFRDWTFLVYPDSAPENWISLLNEKHLTFGVSPLHNADKNGDETEKKPHWHVHIKYVGAKSYANVLEDIKGTNGTRPEKVSNPVGLIRYFVHMDNPEKARYNIEDIQCFGGFDKYADDAFKMGTTDVNAIMCDMQDWITQNQITEYEDLWAFTTDLPKWRYVLNMYNCHGINRLITSIRNRKNVGNSN